jgi:hypothetical protein
MSTNLKGALKLFTINFIFTCISQNVYHAQYYSDSIWLLHPYTTACMSIYSLGFLGKGLFHIYLKSPWAVGQSQICPP